MFEVHAQRNLSISEPAFPPGPSETMPGRNLPDRTQAARISNLIDEELKVRYFNSAQFFPPEMKSHDTMCAERVHEEKGCAKKGG